MKSGQLFWGALFLTLGGLILGAKLGIVSGDWSLVYDFWPLIFVFWGLAILFRNTNGRPVIAFVNGLFIGLLLYGFLRNVFVDIDHDDDYFSDHEKVSTISEDYYDSLKYANLDIAGGVGSIIISDTTGKLILGKTVGNIGGYRFDDRTVDSTIYLDFDLKKKNYDMFDPLSENKLELKLNKNPEWDFNFEIGAAKAYFDLREFKVRNLILSTGAARTKIKIGEQDISTYINVSMGAASLQIDIPETAGCKITGDLVLVAKDISGFNYKDDDGYYITENYEYADQRIVIDISGGVASFAVDRY